jgi:hypothetical protein
MMNFRVSFTTCKFSEADLQSWIAWLKTNIEVRELSIEQQEDDHASDAEDIDSAAKRVRGKRVGG